jgi:tRNA pseudouridine38-40 synthase
LTQADWTEERLAGGGRLLIFEISGNGFLKYMVRAIVGTLVEVGDGRRTPRSIADLLLAGHRSAAGPTAPAAGLYLVRVDYDPAAPVSFS